MMNLQLCNLKENMQDTIIITLLKLICRSNYMNKPIIKDNVMDGD